MKTKIKFSLYPLTKYVGEKIELSPTQIKGWKLTYILYNNKLYTGSDLRIMQNM